MYRTVIQNEGKSITIHDAGPNKRKKLVSGKINREPNSIDSYSFEMYPENAGYDAIHPFQTLVNVYNTAKKRYEFKGRVLKAYPEMDENGSVVKRVICEGRMGYLNDSIQPYIAMTHYEGDASRTGLEEFIDVVLGNHNERVEASKRIYRGRVTVNPFKTSDAVTKQLSYQTTWAALKEKLIGSYGGYLVLRETEGIMYLDYLAEVGTTRATSIRLGHNMKSASRELDPTSVITRLYPLGAKIKIINDQGEEEETEERVSIRSVNPTGKDYIESADYIAVYGIMEGTMVWDEVTLPTNLYTKGVSWLAENNGIYSGNRITALDLSLLGIDADDFVLYDRYPVYNELIGLNDTLQIVKQTIDTVQPEQSTFEMGDTVRRMSDVIADSTNPDAGKPGRNSYTHIRYSANATGADMSVTPTDSTKYIGLCETASPLAPTDYTAYTWSRYVGEDGENGSDGKDGTNGKDGKDGAPITITSHVTEYQQSSSGSTAPTGTWKTTIPTVEQGYFLWSRTTIIYSDGTTTVSYSVSRQGVDGANGTNGINGRDGKDGTSNYVHIKYAPVANPTDAQISESVNEYIGICVDTNEADPTTASAYTWSKFMGADGANGINGTNGKDGTSTYVHFAYATGANGENFSVYHFADATYIGVLTDNTLLDSETPSDYTWSLIKGEDGDGIESTEITYKIGTSGTTPPTGTWSTSVPSVTGNEGKYLWSRTVTNYTNGNNSTQYSVSYIARDGVNGQDGKDGKDGTNGVSVTAVTPYYCAGASNTTKPSSPSIPAWTVQAPTLQYGQYLWCAYRITYSAGDPAWTEPFYVKSADDIIQSSAEPDNPTTGMLWLDTSSEHYYLMRYNGTEWVDVSDATEQFNTFSETYSQKFNTYDESLESITRTLGTVTTSVSDTEEIVEKMITALDMDSSGVSLTFQNIANQMTTIGDNVQTQQSNLERFIRFINGMIELGERGSDTILRLENDILGFYQNGVRVAYFDTGTLYVNKLVGNISLQLGRYAFIPNTTGGMALKYIGE